MFPVQLRDVQGLAWVSSPLSYHTLICSLSPGPTLSVQDLSLSEISYLQNSRVRLQSVASLVCNSTADSHLSVCYALLLCVLCSWPIRSFPKKCLCSDWSEIECDCEWLTDTGDQWPPGRVLQTCYNSFIVRSNAYIGPHFTSKSSARLMMFIGNQQMVKATNMERRTRLLYLELNCGL